MAGALGASPPTRRVVDVIETFVRRPDRSLGLSEVARVCDISKPTCLAILTELSAADYLRFDAATKTYGLGSALVGAGQAAQRSFALDPVVAARMQELSDRFGSMAVAAAHDGAGFVIVGVTAPAETTPATHIGQRFPIVLPTASLFSIGRSDEPAAEGLQAMADEYRAAGYLVENLSPTLERVYRIIGENSHALAPEVIDLITDLLADMREDRLLYRSALAADPAAVHRVGAVSAPCFDVDGEQSLMIALYAHADLTGAEVAERGDAVRAVADAVTAALGGRVPTHAR